MKEACEELNTPCQQGQHEHAGLELSWEQKQMLLARVLPFKAGKCTYLTIPRTVASSFDGQGLEGSRDVAIGFDPGRLPLHGGGHRSGTPRQVRVELACTKSGRLQSERSE